MSRPAWSVPIVNLNGSDPKTMVDDILAALNALRVALDAVEKAAPHPRDWQTSIDGAKQFVLARDQHLVRTQALRDTLAELEAIAISIQEQAAKGRRK